MGSMNSSFCMLSWFYSGIWLRRCVVILFQNGLLLPHPRVQSGSCERLGRLLGETICIAFNLKFGASIHDGLMATDIQVQVVPVSRM